MLVVECAEGGAERMSAAVGELLPGVRPVRMRAPLTGGRRHASWVLDTAVGAVVGKLIREPAASVPARLAEQRRVHAAGAPVPRILTFSAETAAVAPDLVVVSEYVGGVDAEECLPSLRPEVAATVMWRAGHAVAALHSAGAPCFGEPHTPSTEGHPTSWAEAVHARTAHLGVAHDRVRMADRGMLTAGRALVAELAEAVSDVVRPAPVHGDVYPPNLLLDDAGRFGTLLDLEHLRWADPVMDFVKPTMWMFPDRAEWAAAYLRGYEAGLGRPERWTERLSVCMGWELLTGIGFWERVGEGSMAADYELRLRRWVASAGTEAGWPGQSR